MTRLPGPRPASSSADTCVVVPAFNEALVLYAVLQQLTELPYLIVVVDDASTDETAHIAMRCPLVLIRHPINLGQGASLQTGLRWALARPATRYIITFDADGQHAPQDIETLLKPLRAGSHDVVLGSRFLRGATAKGIPRSRSLALRVAARIARISPGLRLTDTHNGLRAFTRSAADQLNIAQNRMAHASEILAQIAALRLRYKEVPVHINYTDYSLGKGQKMSSGMDIVWDLATQRLR